MALELNGTTGVSAVQAGAVESGDLPAGSVIQVVSTVKTDTFSQTYSGNSTFSNDVTGLTTTITPVLSNSILMIFLNINVGSTTSNADVTLFRDGSATYIGDADGSKGRTSTLRQLVNSAPDSSNQPGNTINVIGSESAASTASTTFSVRLRHLSSSTQTVYVNRVDSESDAGFSPRPPSSLTIMEVAG